MKRLSDYEDYQAAASRLNGLRGELAELERERDRLYIDLNSHKGTRENGVEAKARALLAGEPSTDAPPLTAKYTAVCQRIEVLQKAVNMQTSTAESLRARYSAEICEAAEKEYFKLTREAVDSAVKQSKAISAAMQYREALEADGVIVTLPRLDFLNRFGRFENGNTHIHHAISEAERAGVIKPGTYEKPQQPGMYDHISTPIQATAAGPNGIAKVEISRGGAVKVKEQTYTPPKPDSQTAWN